VIATVLVMVEHLEAMVDGYVVAFFEATRDYADVFKAFRLEILYYVSHNAFVVRCYVQTALLVRFKFLR
jgi:hypothetical protein